MRAVVAEERAEAGAVSSSMLAASSRLEAGLSAAVRQPQEPDRTVIGAVTLHSACTPFTCLLCNGVTRAVWAQGARPAPSSSLTADSTW